MFTFRGVLVALAMAARVSAADDAPSEPPLTEAQQLAARGEELGRQGQWTQAITAFKKADALEKRTSHVCSIALAYTRRELWAQAELYFARCHARANTSDPAPDWVAEAETQLAAKLVAANVPALTISTDAPGAVITVSGFEADDTLAPGVVHLTPGHYSIRATAPDRLPASREVDIVEGKSQDLSFTLEAPPPTKVVMRPNPARDTKLPWAVIGTGVALVGAGIAVDLVKLQPLRDQLAKSQYENDHDSDFTTWRTATVAMWGAGAIAIGIGTWLELRRRELPLTIAASVDRSGGFVAVGWSR